jgi:hypothetical protein
VTHRRSLLSEPADSAYLQLLAFAESRATTFSLVWREQLSFDPSAESIEASLRPFLEREVRTSEWPGTQIIGHFAIVRFYRLTPVSAEVLALASGLYAWVAPQLPEDLAFYAADGRCWLGSVAHEQDSFVDRDPDGLKALRDAVPALALSKSRGSGT